MFDKNVTIPSVLSAYKKSKVAHDEKQIEKQKELDKKIEIFYPLIKNITVDSIEKSIEEGKFYCEVYVMNIDYEVVKKFREELRSMGYKCYCKFNRNYEATHLIVKWDYN